MTTSMQTRPDPRTASVAAERHRGSGGSRDGPRGRPSTSARTVLGLTTAAGMAAGSMLMVSDTAPMAAEVLLGDALLFDSDRAAHLVIWFALSLTMALTLWSWSGLVHTAATMTMFGLLVEVAQGLFTTTRVVDVADLEADLIGTAGGLVAATLVIASRAVLHRLRRRHPGPVIVG